MLGGLCGCVGVFQRALGKPAGILLQLEAASNWDSFLSPLLAQLSGEVTR